MSFPDRSIINLKPSDKLEKHLDGGGNVKVISLREEFCDNHTDDVFHIVDE